jgi:hypothetical protein
MLSEGKPSVQPKRTSSRKACETWRYQAGDDIPEVIRKGDDSYQPTGIYKEFLEFAKLLPVG